MTGAEASRATAMSNPEIVEKMAILNAALEARAGLHHGCESPGTSSSSP
jgi:hypothetical protein